MAARMETSKQATGDTQLIAQTEPTMNVSQDEAELGKYSFKGPRIYVGPNVRTKGLHFGSGFRDGLPRAVAELCSKCPEIFELFVEPAHLMEFREKMARKGTAEHQALLTASKFLTQNPKEV